MNLRNHQEPRCRFGDTNGPFLNPARVWIALFLLSSACTAAPTTKPKDAVTPSIPRGFQLRDSAKPEEPRETLHDITYVRRGLAEAAIEPKARGEADRLLAVAEEKVVAISVAIERQPAAREELRNEAQRVHSDLDRQLLKVLKPAQVGELRRACVVLFVQDLSALEILEAYANEPGADANEPRDRLGLKLTDEQKGRIRAFLDEREKDLPRPARETDSEHDRLKRYRMSVSALNATRSKWRKILTDEQLKRLDQWALTAFNKASDEEARSRD